jgi:hypothetical protein
MALAQPTELLGTENSHEDDVVQGLHILASTVCSETTLQTANELLEGLVQFCSPGAEYLVCWENFRSERAWSQR